MASADDLIDLFAKGVRMGEDTAKAGANAADGLKTAARSTDGAADATRATDGATIPEVHGKDWVKFAQQGIRLTARAGDSLTGRSVTSAVWELDWEPQGSEPLASSDTAR